MTNSKSTKRALVSSALAVLMCVAMLIGTTFAWFTSTASTAVNKIQAGTLKIQLLDEEGKSLEGKMLKWQKAKDHEDDEVLWEPGCTYNLQPVTIKNAGNLALKYKVVITGINGDAKLNEAIEWTINDEALDSDNKLAAGSSNTLTIRGHMKESAGNEYQGLSIDGIAITVYATQDTVEYDSNGNQYDNDAKYLIPWDGKTTTAPDLNTEDNKYHITNAAEFASFITTVTAGGKYCHQTISIDTDIDLGGQVIKTTAAQGNRQLDGVKIDGNGYTISNFTLDSTANPEGYYGGLFGYMAGYHDSYIKNLNVKNATVIGGKQTGVIIGGINGANSTVENCKVYNCTVIGTKKVGAVVGYTANGYVKNCYAENCTVYCAENDVNEAGEVVGFINTVDAGTKNNTSGNTFKNVTVNVGKSVTAVTNANELKTALHKGNNIFLTNDIVLNGDWTPVRVDTPDNYRPIANSISIDGAGHSISGLTASLLGFSPAQYVKIENLTIKNSDIKSGKDNDANCGAFVSILDDATISFEMKNCHAVNVTVNAKNDGNNEAYGAGVLVGENGMLNNGKTFTVSDCTVTDCSVTNSDGNAAGIVGMCATPTTISNCKLSNVTVKGESNEKQGQIAGTVNGSDILTIENCTYTGNAVGRTVGNATVTER